MVLGGTGRPDFELNGQDQSPGPRETEGGGAHPSQRISAQMSGRSLPDTGRARAGLGS